MTSKRFDPLSIVSKIAKQEKELIDSTFVAPYVGGGKVRLNLAGIVFEMEVADCPQGWAIMQVIGVGKARFIQAATPSMVRNYLRLLPRLRLVFVDQFDERWWALAALTGGQKIELNGPVSVQLTERAASFDIAYCRFDGNNFWFESLDRRRDPSVARSLRQELSKNKNPDELHCKGMLPSEKLAYKMLWAQKNKDKEVLRQLSDRERVELALEHSGATLDAFWYAPGSRGASARFEVDGRTHIVEFRPSDLTVTSAGICLSGQDQNFDLSSLVGVLREADSGYHFD